jgi:SIR2-like domain
VENAKLPIAVLLGAGASADAGIPTTIGMTDAVIDRMEIGEHVRVLEFVRHTLAADLAQRQPKGWERRQDIHVKVDVERLFASIELLIDRHNEPWSPFVATWHPGLESFLPGQTVRAFDLTFELEAVDRAVMRTPGRLETRSSIKNSLGRLIERAMQRGRPGDLSDLLKKVRAEMLRSLFEIVEIDPSRVAYLKPLIELARRQGSLAIATLNYDRSIENVAEDVGEDYDTGIETWLSRGEFGWPESGLRLLKLHGSIDWVLERGVTPPDEIPVLRIAKATAAEDKARSEGPAVVFGEGGKLRSEGPFLELLLAWSAELKRADNLLVVGYSFRDQHVNELIGRWFNASDVRRIILVDPEPDQRSPFAHHLAQFGSDRYDKSSPNRFEHIVGTTDESLAQGIAAVSRSLASAR